MDSGDWDDLCLEAHHLGGDLDVRLSSYAKLGAGYANARALVSRFHWKSMEMEIENLLELLLDVNEAMSRCTPAATPATTVAQKLTRHHDILHEFTQEFKRTKGNILSMREHAELLTSVRNDINEHKVYVVCVVTGNNLRI